MANVYTFLPFLQDIQKTFLTDIILYTIIHHHPTGYNTTLIYLYGYLISPSNHSMSIFISFHQIFTLMFFHEVKDSLKVILMVLCYFCKTFPRKKSNEHSWSPFFILVHDKYRQVYEITIHWRNDVMHDLQTSLHLLILLFCQFCQQFSSDTFLKETLSI